MAALLPEWSARRALVLRWPWRPDIWPHAGKSAQTSLLALLHTLAEPLAQRHIDLQLEVPVGKVKQIKPLVPPSVQLIESPYADIWIRDCAPFYVGDGEVAPTQAQLQSYVGDFNGWGGLDCDYHQDLLAREALCQRFGLTPQALPCILEGGSIHTDGAGTLVYIASSVLDSSRNPKLTEQAFAALLKDYFAASRIIVIVRGLASDETGGHADNLLTFLTPQQCLVSMPEPHHIDFANAQQCASLLIDAGYEVLYADQPELALSASEALHIRRRDGVKPRLAGMPLTASYTNGIRIDNLYVLPQFGVPQDSAMQGMLAAACPSLEIITANARALLVGGGGWHCASHAVV